MTAKETHDIIKDSSLWDALTVGEKIEALVYAVESIGCLIGTMEDDSYDVSDIVGEIFSV